MAFSLGLFFCFVGTLAGYSVTGVTGGRICLFPLHEKNLIVPDLMNENLTGHVDLCSNLLSSCI